MHNKGFVHRDIKLENIILDSDFNLKLIDFDLAEPISRGNLNQQTVTGTTGYIAPELLYPQPQHGQRIDLKKADVFSLGVVLFIMVKGCQPFENPSREDKWYS